jgi:hypothetical protein
VSLLCSLCTSPAMHKGFGNSQIPRPRAASAEPGEASEAGGQPAKTTAQQVPRGQQAPGLGGSRRQSMAILRTWSLYLLPLMLFTSHRFLHRKYIYSIYGAFHDFFVSFVAADGRRGPREPRQDSGPRGANEKAAGPLTAPGAARMPMVEQVCGRRRRGVDEVRGRPTLRAGLVRLVVKSSVNMGMCSVILVCGRQRQIRCWRVCSKDGGVVALIHILHH